MTGLKRRPTFEDEIEKCLRRNSAVALMIVDIDNFKLVNDRIGHASGDEVLVHTAKILLKKIVKISTGYINKLKNGVHTTKV